MFLIEGEKMTPIFQSSPFCTPLISYICIALIKLLKE